VSDLYFIVDDEARAVKIGKSDNPAGRLAHFQTGSARRLRLALAVKEAGELESWLHQVFGANRLDGEWFKNAGWISCLLEARIRYFAEGDGPLRKVDFLRCMAVGMLESLMPGSEPGDTASWDRGAWEDAIAWRQLVAVDFAVAGEMLSDLAHRAVGERLPFPKIVTCAEGDVHSDRLARSEESLREICPPAFAPLLGLTDLPTRVLTETVAQ